MPSPTVASTRYNVLADSMGAQYVGVEGAWAIAELLKHSYIAAGDRDLYDSARLAAVRLEPGGPLMEVFPTLQEARQWLVAG